MIHIDCLQLLRNDSHTLDVPFHDSGQAIREGLRQTRHLLRDAFKEGNHIFLPQRHFVLSFAFGTVSEKFETELRLMGELDINRGVNIPERKVSL